MIGCPSCGDPLSTRGVCGSCGYGRRGAKLEPSHGEGDRYAILAERAKQDFQQNVPSAESLTDQQWYNVCKFFPFIATHCKRLRPEMGPHNPLDASARLGPILSGRFRDMEAEAERAALQAA